MMDNNVIEKLIKKLPEIKDWINDTLSKYTPEAKLIKDLNFDRLHLYFSDNLLSTTKVIEIKEGRVPKPPLTKMGLREFREFEEKDDEGIAFKDSYFIKSRSIRIESMHFHELIHIIQWNALGIEKFIQEYAMQSYRLGKYNYDKNLLEMMAYYYQALFEASLKPGILEGEICSTLDNINLISDSKFSSP